jgi:hypothetical protein
VENDLGRFRHLGRVEHLRVPSAVQFPRGNG